MSGWRVLKIRLITFKFKLNAQYIILMEYFLMCAYVWQDFFFNIKTNLKNIYKIKNKKNI